MKTGIAFFALTVSVFAVIGCAGTPAAVDRFGKMQPGVQRFEPSTNDGEAEAETMPFFMPVNRFGALSLFGLNDFKAGQMPMAYRPTYRLPYHFGGPLTLFNGTQIMQKPLEVVFPYNYDASLTLFSFNDFQITIPPMTDGRF